MNAESTSPLGDEEWSRIVELRRYTLRPGMRETLIDLFDRHFVEPQEEVGMKVIGQFRDLDVADTFTWVRGFPSMSARALGLSAFYGGPVWRAHRQAANATMLDSDDVLLLRPARSGSGFHLPSERPATVDPDQGVVEATIVPVHPTATAETLACVDDEVRSVVTSSGGHLLACFVTETAANNFPALPIREGVHVAVWFSGFGPETAYDRSPHGAAVTRRVANTAPELSGEPEVLRLRPTPRSLLTGG